MFAEEAIPYDYRVPAHRQRTVDDLDRELDREERFARIRANRAVARREDRKDTP